MCPYVCLCLCVGMFPLWPRAWPMSYVSDGPASPPQCMYMCFILSPFGCPWPKPLCGEKTATQGYLWPTHTHTHTETSCRNNKKAALKKQRKMPLKNVRFAGYFQIFIRLPPVRPSLVPNCAQNQRLKAVDVQLFFFFFLLFFWSSHPKGWQKHLN